jgi:hypothetical protein
MRVLYLAKSRASLEISKSNSLNGGEGKRCHCDDKFCVDLVGASNSFTCA